MRKLLKWIFIIFIGLIVLGLILGNGADEQATTDSDSDVAVSPSEQGVASEPQGVVDVAEVGGLTRPQKNAVRSAEQYISMSGFSRDGLIDQLSSEFGNGYDVSDATVAVDSLNIDWNEQAVRTAKQYLDMSGFSCDGLIEQLSSEHGNKYSVSEATYGAQQAGACS